MKSMTADVVKTAFRRVVPAQILGYLVAAVNTFVDGIITGQILGTAAMSAIGCFVPISIIIGVLGVVSIGAQILCGRFIGSGDGKKVVSLFSSVILLLGMISILVSVVLFAARYPLSGLLGAERETMEMTAQYMAGYAPGVIGQVFSSMFTLFLPLNNDGKRSYIGVGLMVGVNIGLDLLLVMRFSLGTFGMGLATASSYLISSGYMFLGFLNRERAIRFHFSGFSFRDIKEAVFLGLPTLLFVIGNAGKTLVMNRTLMVEIGNDGVAAMNVLNSICGFLGSIPQGFSNAYLGLGSIYYGEEDRESFLGVTRISLAYGALAAAVSMVGVMIFSPVLASVFFAPEEAAWGITRRMFIIFPIWLVFNVIFFVLMKGYQCENKIRFVNVMSAVEQVLTGFFAVLGLRLMGPDGVWVSYAAANVACILIIMLTMSFRAKKPVRTLEEWMQLPAEFGASKDQCMNVSMGSMEDVINVSEKVMDFCQKRSVDKKRSFFAALAVEEMAGNVVTHGFSDGKKHSVDLRVVAKEGLTIRLRDDCREFDPKKRMEQFTPKEAEKNIGIRMIAGLSKEMIYQNNVGINTLLVKI